MNNKWHLHPIRVHYKETDQMGVVHHANYVSWFEIGRTEKMRSVGIAYSEMEDLGLLLPVIDLDVKYHKPARYDDCVAIYTKLSHFTAVRMQFDYEVRRIEEEADTNVDMCSVVSNDKAKTSEPTGELPAAIRGEATDKEKPSEPTGDLLASGKTLHMWLNDQWRPTRIDRIAPDVFNTLHELCSL